MGETTHADVSPDLQARLQKAIDRERAAKISLDDASDLLERVLDNDEATDEERTAARDEMAAARAKFDQESAGVDDVEHLIEARSRVPRDRPPADTRAGDIKITRMEPTYRQDKPGFFLDLALARRGDPSAFERLYKNNREAVDVIDDYKRIPGGWRTELRMMMAVEERAISSSANAGGQFIAPVWLLDRYAAKLRAGRAYLNALGTMEFVNEMGNSINVPSITTGSTTTFGTSENSAVSNTDLVTGSITAATQTNSGQTKASYQLIQLSQAGMDRIIFDDISRDYTKKLDDFALNSTVTNAKGILQVSGTNAVTYTDASPTVPELYPFIFQGKSSVEKSVFDAVDFACMHPSTWNWYISALDTANRPLAAATNEASFNMLANFEPTTAQGLAGNLNGIPVITDANVPVNLGGGTNQAPILLINRMAHDFWEGVPTFAVADQTGISSLQYVFVLYGYAAQMSRQAAGASVINGTGMIVQSGF